MKYLIAAGLLLLLLLSFQQCRSTHHALAENAYEVTGSILFRHAYCGGARPSDDQLHPQPVPVKGTTLYIRRVGKNEVVDSAITDSSGNFSVKLAAGTYCFVEKWKTKKLVMPVDSKYATWDTACYRKQYESCEYTLNVKNNTPGINIVLQRYCSWSRPCCSYDGPLPPAAPPTNKGGYQPGHQE